MALRTVGRKRFIHLRQYIGESFNEWGRGRALNLSPSSGWAEFDGLKDCGSQEIYSSPSIYWRVVQRVWEGKGLKLIPEFRVGGVRWPQGLWVARDLFISVNVLTSRSTSGGGEGVLNLSSSSGWAAQKKLSRGQTRPIPSQNELGSGQACLSCR